MSATTADSTTVSNSYASLDMQCAHGLLMISAWMLLASVGLVVSRFYKPAWPAKNVFGARLWFTIHRACMVLTLLLDVAAFILIFIEAQGYIGTGAVGIPAAHPAIGIVVTALVIINPIMALFRCDSNHPKRPIFTWTHTYIGYIAHILACSCVAYLLCVISACHPCFIDEVIYTTKFMKERSVTDMINIFFGFYLYVYNNPIFPVYTVAWIMFAFVMFHIFSEAVLQTHSQLRLWQQQQRTLAEKDVDRLHRERINGQGVQPANNYGGELELNTTKAGEPGEPLPDYDNSNPSSPSTSQHQLAAKPNELFSSSDYRFIHGYLCFYILVVLGLWVAMVVLMSTNI